VDVQGWAVQNVSWLMLLLDFAVELQQLHQLSKDLGRAIPGQDAMNSPLPEVFCQDPTSGP